ncbi:MAG: hypothetical protein R3C05_06055 [Pirellulaceae bacterium]
MSKLGLLCGAVALLIALVLVPLVRSLALRLGIVDNPDPTRKLHAGVTALGVDWRCFCRHLPPFC